MEGVWRMRGASGREKGGRRTLLAGLASLAGATGCAVYGATAMPSAEAGNTIQGASVTGAGRVVAAPRMKVHQVPVWSDAVSGPASPSPTPGSVSSVTDTPGNVYFVNPVNGAPTTRRPATSTWAPYADLVHGSAQDNGATVTMTAKTVESNTYPTYNPSKDANWTANDTYIGWQFLTTPNSTPEYEVYFQFASTGKANAVLFHTADHVTSEVSCRVQQSYSQATGYEVQFSTECIPGLSAFTWNVFSHYDVHANDPTGQLAIGKALPDPFDNGGVRYASTVIAGSATPQVSGYRLVATDGGVFDFGSAQFDGSMGGSHLNKPVVGGAATLDGDGYWLVAADGGIFSFGDAVFYGSTGSMHLNQPIVGMAVDPHGDGYWLVAADGGIFSFGGATFYGSTGNLHLNQPIVGMAADPTGNGYWLVAADGGIFSFGGATFFGSAAGTHLHHAAVGMAADPAGDGYWIVTDEGRLFTYGKASTDGFTAGTVHLNQPIVGMAADPAGGYWLVAADGGIFAFGGTPFYGSTGNIHLNEPIVGMAVP
jgi:hypothetical protein